MFSAFQTDIYLPEGLSIKQVDGAYCVALTDRKSDHVVSVAKQSDGAMRILAYSISSAEFSGNSGNLALFTVVADNDFNSGDIRITNTIFSQKDMSEYLFNDEYTAVNGDNSVVSIESDNSYISVSNGAMTVHHANSDAAVKIYNMNGVLLYSTTIAQVSSIRLPQGIYIVKVNESIKKVVL